MLEKILFWITRIISILFLVSIFILLIGVDFLPFLLLSCLCIVFYLEKNSEKHEIFKESFQIGYFTTFQYIIRIVVITLFLIGFIVLLGILGLSTIYTHISNFLQIYPIFRYGIYGIFFPVFITYFLTWFISSYRPIFYGLNSKTCIIVLFVCLFIGVFICINWESYLKLNTQILNNLKSMYQLIISPLLVK